MAIIVNSPLLNKKALYVKGAPEIILNRCITGQYVLCRIAPARQAIAEETFDEALKWLHETDAYPHNSGEGKLINAGFGYLG
ncbi:MAG: hypothetical protein LBC19_00700 [Tannerella sp.]|jgi:magnesium-transporting ATPase (P-type)|nr:hypothetical protein [Tannerella sp.]